MNEAIDERMIEKMDGNWSMGAVNFPLIEPGSRFGRSELSNICMEEQCSMVSYK
jgi:hypothetical protein